MSATNKNVRTVTARQLEQLRSELFPDSSRMERCYQLTATKIFAQMPYAGQVYLRQLLADVYDEGFNDGYEAAEQENREGQEDLFQAGYAAGYQASYEDSYDYAYGM